MWDMGRGLLGEMAEMVKIEIHTPISPSKGRLSLKVGSPQVLTDVLADVRLVQSHAADAEYLGHKAPA